MATAMSPLSDVRVLDLTNVLAGPFCCHQLAHLGADVIKIEVPGRGDLARQLGADPDLNERLMGVSFLAQNAGKRSITVNLKREKGKELLKRLAATAACSNGLKWAWRKSQNSTRSLPFACRDPQSGDGRTCIRSSWTWLLAWAAQR